MTAQSRKSPDERIHICICILYHILDLKPGSFVDSSFCAYGTQLKDTPIENRQSWTRVEQRKPPPPKYCISRPKLDASIAGKLPLLNSRHIRNFEFGLPRKGLREELPCAAS